MLWLTDIEGWNKLKVVDKLELLRKHYCTGPCGQSNSVHKTREVTNQTLKEAIDLLEIMKDYHHYV